jgi:ribosomal protein L35
MKGNKSYSKRLRVTKNGKIVSRAPGQNHFNAKESGAKRQQHRRAGAFHATLSNTDKSRFFPRSH